MPEPWAPGSDRLNRYPLSRAVFSFRVKADPSPRRLPFLAAYLPRCRLRLPYAEFITGGLDDVDEHRGPFRLLPTDPFPPLPERRVRGESSWPLLGQASPLLIFVYEGVLENFGLKFPSIPRLARSLFPALSSRISSPSSSSD